LALLGALAAFITLANFITSGYEYGRPGIHGAAGNIGLRSAFSHEQLPLPWLAVCLLIIALPGSFLALFADMSQRKVKKRIPGKIFAEILSLLSFSDPALSCQHDA
jgi:hypothetical protein